MNKLTLIKLATAFAVVSLFCAMSEFSVPARSSAVIVANLSFDVSFPVSASNEALDGRLLLLISTNNERRTSPSDQRRPNNTTSVWHRC